MKQTTTTLILLLTVTLSAYSQVDYIEYKDRYNLSCGIPDSSVIVRNQQLVDSLQNLKITNGQKEYLYDHGWVYYIRYLKWKDLTDLKISASSFDKGWNQYQDLDALWNLGGINGILGNCEKSLDLTELYLQEIPDSIDVDYKQVYYRYKFCRTEK
jgi:hypothetical protein